MITPPTECFYIMLAEGAAANAITKALSPGLLADIAEVVLISEDFDNDIQATLGLDYAVQRVKAYLTDDCVERTALNPLYTPLSDEALDDVFDSEEGFEEQFSFTGMDGNPFTMKTVNLTVDDEILIQGKVSCKPFDLPSYNEIMQAQGSTRLN